MKISIIFGTRPEAIKLVPVISALRKEKKIKCNVCVTAQHREMLDQVLDIFEILPDVDLNIMRPNQRLPELTANSLKALNSYLLKERPDLVIVQGDTTTTFVASLAAFYNNIPVAHVEAGLRTGNMKAPWPEEANRVLTSRLATLHFAPTDVDRKNLIEEGIPLENIFVTGNTVIDTLFFALEKVKNNPPNIVGIDSSIFKLNADPIVLITGHRRENIGGGFKSICRAITELARKFPKVQFIYPVHLNPNVKLPVMRMLGTNCNDKKRLGNIHLIAPLPYLSFVYLMSRSIIILTDSGGIQEEAPSLGKPVLVMRDTTERPDAVKGGSAKLVGTDYKTIIKEVELLLSDQSVYKKMACLNNPYGDGKAAVRIIKICKKFIYSEYHA